MPSKLDIFLAKLSLANKKIADSINLVDDDTDENTLAILEVQNQVRDIISLLGGTTDSPILFDTDIADNLDQLTQPARGKIVDSSDAWLMRQQLDSLLETLSGFDGDGNPNDYIENLNQLIGWANTNTQLLDAMSPATPTSSGFMSSAQASKLSGIETNANKTILSSDPEDNSSVRAATTALTHQLKGYIESLQIAMGDLSAKTHTHDVATTEIPGFMSIEDKTKLDALELPVEGELTDRSPTAGNLAAAAFIDNNLDVSALVSSLATPTTTITGWAVSLDGQNIYLTLHSTGAYHLKIVDGKWGVQQEIRVHSGPYQFPQSCAINRDGTVIAQIGYNGVGYLVTVIENGTYIDIPVPSWPHTFGYPNSLSYIALSADGTELMAATSSGLITIVKLDLTNKTSVITQHFSYTDFSSNTGLHYTVMSESGLVIAGHAYASVGNDLIGIFERPDLTSPFVFTGEYEYTSRSSYVERPIDISLDGKSIVGYNYQYGGTVLSKQGDVWVDKGPLTYPDEWSEFPWNNKNLSRVDAHAFIGNGEYLAIQALSILDLPSLLIFYKRQVDGSYKVISVLYEDSFIDEAYTNVPGTYRTITNQPTVSRRQTILRRTDDGIALYVERTYGSTTTTGIITLKSSSDWEQPVPIHSHLTMEYSVDMTGRYRNGLVSPEFLKRFVERNESFNKIYADIVDYYNDFNKARTYRALAPADRLRVDDSVIRTISLDDTIDLGGVPINAYSEEINAANFRKSSIFYDKKYPFMYVIRYRQGYPYQVLAIDMDKNEVIGVGELPNGLRDVSAAGYRESDGKIFLAGKGHFGQFTPVKDVIVPIDYKKQEDYHSTVMLWPSYLEGPFTSEDCSTVIHYNDTQYGQDIGGKSVLVIMDWDENLQDYTMTEFTRTSEGFKEFYISSSETYFLDVELSGDGLHLMVALRNHKSLGYETIIGLDRSAIGQPFVYRGGMLNAYNDNGFRGNRLYSNYDASTVLYFDPRTKSNNYMQLMEGRVWHPNNITRSTLGTVPASNYIKVNPECTKMILSPKLGTGNVNRTYITELFDFSKGYLVPQGNIAADITDVEVSFEFPNDSFIAVSTPEAYDRKHDITILSVSKLLDNKVTRPTSFEGQAGNNIAIKPELLKTFLDKNYKPETYVGEVIDGSGYHPDINTAVRRAMPDVFGGTDMYAWYLTNNLTTLSFSRLSDNGLIRTMDLVDFIISDFYFLNENREVGICSPVNNKNNFRVYDFNTNTHKDYFFDITPVSFTFSEELIWFVDSASSSLVSYRKRDRVSFGKPIALPETDYKVRMFKNGLMILIPLQTTSDVLIVDPIRGEIVETINAATLQASGEYSFIFMDNNKAYVHCATNGQRSLSLNSPITDSSWRLKLENIGLEYDATFPFINKVNLSNYSSSVFANRSAMFGSYQSNIQAINGNNVVMLSSYNTDAGGNFETLWGYNGLTAKVNSNTGTGHFAGGTQTLGADYAEYFKNLSDEIIPVGSVVVMENGKVCLGRDTDDPDDILGVVSANPSVVGNEATFNWHGKNLKDEFGKTLMEVVDIMDEDGQVIGSVEQPIINPDYDPDKEYLARAERETEWTLVGLLGQIFVRTMEEVTTKYVGVDGKGSISKTPLRIMETMKPFDPDAGYGIVKCLLK